MECRLKELNELKKVKVLKRSFQDGFCYTRVALEKAPSGMLTKLLDRDVGHWVKNRDNWTCITCGKQGNQAGHFVSRSIHGVRWDYRNLHCQCYNCNCLQSGQPIIYAKKIRETYGESVLKYLLSYSLAHANQLELTYRQATWSSKAKINLYFHNLNKLKGMVDYA